MKQYKYNLPVEKTILIDHQTSPQKSLGDNN